MNRPMGNDRVVQPSALHLSPGLRHKDLPPFQLVQVNGEREEPWAPFSGVAEFVVTTPEVRCRVKGVLTWVPRADNPLVSLESYWTSGPPVSSLFGATGIWLAKRDEMSINGRGAVPVENLAGDIFAPLPIPEVGCLGWLFEIETAGQEVWGRFTVDGASVGPGQWMFRATCDAIDPMTDVEWNRVHSRFAARAIVGITLRNGNPG